MGNVVDGLKDQLFERVRDYWPENPGTDVAEDSVAIHVLRAEVQAGVGT